MIDKILLNQLVNAGVTAPADNIPSIYKVGCGLDSESTTISHTETKGKKKQHTITVIDNCFCYSWQYSFSPNHAEIVRTKAAITSVLHDIVDTVKAANKATESEAIYIIWCANLAHEWAFIKNEICNDFEITKCFAKSPRDVLYVQLENCVEFRECIGLFGHSLKDIAKNWCSADNQKLSGDDFNYSKVRTWFTPLDSETEVPYMKHDVTVLSEMHLKVIAAYTQANGVCRLPYTSSGFVRMALKDSIRNDEDLTSLREIWNERHKKKIETNIEYLNKVNERCVINPLQWHICRDFSYSGGLCGSNIKLAGKILNDVVCADLTSDYPAQLSQQLFPYGSLQEVKAENLNDVKNYLLEKHIPFFAVLKIKYMKAKTQHATFSEHKIINAKSDIMDYHGKPKDMIIYNGKVYSGKNLIVCWNDVDIKAYSEIYNIKAGVLTIWKFDKYKRLPKWFLTTLWNGYRKKAELKNSGIKSGVVYEDAKRIPNSMYGVLATRINDSYDTIDVDHNFKVGKEKQFDQLRKDFWLNPYVAFWCTSYARSILMHFLSRFPDVIVQYDTDSLYYLKDKGESLEKALHEYNHNVAVKNHRIFRYDENPLIFETLGQWDFDDVYPKFLAMGAKKYIKQDVTGGIHTVVAGLPKSAIPKEIQDRGIHEPFNYYNPLIQWVQNNHIGIIIKHVFANKFASVYNDRTDREYISIIDHLGNHCLQDVLSYHAIIPIDFTLSMARDYMEHILKGR